MNCTSKQQCPETTTNCRRELQALLHEVNKQLWNSYKTDPEYLADADLYTITILCLFASVILVLMVRSIKPSESVDDQVTILLNSMRVRVEFEDNARQRQKLREAKRKAQRWLAEAKQRSCKKLSFSGSFRLRTKSDSDALQQGSSSIINESPPENISMKSNPIQIPSTTTRKKSSSTSTAPYQHTSISISSSIPAKSMTATTKTFPRKPIIYQRAASYQFLPEIVVTSTHHNEDPPNNTTTTNTKGYNRVPTSQSYDDDSEEGGGEGPSTSCGIKDVFSVV
uniref:Uncharacterized protein n=1 Tax=Panagrolaimus sp. ES5 TaxID=591445 RepID=A0AC34G7G5_9BILA